MASMHILVTGSTDGIGSATAEALVRTGHVVYIHGRNADKVARKVATGAARGFVADLASLEETARLAREVAEAVPELDVLINNAGVGTGGRAGQRETSRDGYELRFAVNYLAPFLLTRNLLARGLPRRAVINVSSIGQEPLDFDDPMLERSYSGASAYCRSKLAQVMFTIDLASQYPQIKTHALHPGTYLDTNMVRTAGVTPFGPPERGADSILAVLQEALADGPSGRYFDEDRPSRANPQAYDPTARHHLRTLSEKLTTAFLTNQQRLPCLNERKRP